MGFKDLIVWQKAMDLALIVYKITDTLPGSEQYGMSSQMRRAAVSIPSNIAEGYRRNNRGEYYHYCSIALGSAAELETQLILASKIYNKDIKVDIGLCIEIQKMLTRLVIKLKNKK